MFRVRLDRPHRSETVSYRTMNAIRRTSPRRLLDFGPVVQTRTKTVSGVKQTRMMYVVAAGGIIAAHSVKHPNTGSFATWVLRTNTESGWGQTRRPLTKLRKIWSDSGREISWLD